MAARTIENVPLPDAATLRDAPHAFVAMTNIDQAGPSYTAHVFLNNPQADADTARTPEQGYLGAFHVYGFGYRPDAGTAQPQQEGHSERHTARLPTRRRLLANKEVLRQAAAVAPTATVTIVPVPAGGRAPANQDMNDVLTVDEISIETNDGIAPATKMEE